MDGATLKLVLAVAFAVVGLLLLWQHRKAHGFTQGKQAGILFIAAAVVFALVGLGRIG